MIRYFLLMNFFSVLASATTFEQLEPYSGLWTLDRCGRQEGAPCPTLLNVTAKDTVDEFGIILTTFLDSDPSKAQLTAFDRAPFTQFGFWNQCDWVGTFRICHRSYATGNRLVHKTSMKRLGLVGETATQYLTLSETQGCTKSGEVIDRLLYHYDIGNKRVQQCVYIRSRDKSKYADQYQ